MDDYARHEALHMADFLGGCVHDQLVEHDVIKSRPEYKALADKAAEALYQLYQEIGKEHFNTKD